MTGGREPEWIRRGGIDTIGLDRLTRSLLRVVSRMRPGALVGVHGAPGGGKDEFVRRLAWLAAAGRTRPGDAGTGTVPAVAWFDAWAWSKQGNLIAGFILSVAHALDQSTTMRDRAREVIGPLGRLHLDGRPPEGSAFGGLSGDPVDELGRAFKTLVDQVRGTRPGRVLVVVDGMDLLTPHARWMLLDGLRLLMRGGAEVSTVLSIGREAAIDAVTSHHGAIPADSARRVLEDYFDLAVTVPNLEVRRIGSLLREYIGNDEGSLRRSFGRDATLNLTAAVAHRPLGSPSFLRRLGLRAVLLAEYASEMRAARELSEAQWAWVIISERWPDFRRYMIRGGRQRWIELNGAIEQMQEHNADARELPRRGPLSLRTGITGWLDDDPILANYLRLHSAGFARNGEGIFWLENLMLAAGL